MLVKKIANTGEVNGVSYLNGEVKFQSVALNVYSFVVDGVLIDTGSQSLRRYFEHFIDEADFDQVRITHFHEDHTGCAAYIQKTKNVPIYIHEKSIRTLVPYGQITRCTGNFFGGKESHFMLRQCQNHLHLRALHGM